MTFLTHKKHTMFFQKFPQGQKKGGQSRRELLPANPLSLLLSPFLTSCFFFWVSQAGTPQSQDLRLPPKTELELLLRDSVFSHEGTQDSENCISFHQMDEALALASPSRPLSLPSCPGLDFRSYLRRGGEPASAPGPRSGADTTACFCPRGLTGSSCGPFCHRNWLTGDGRVKLSL